MFFCELEVQRFSLREIFNLIICQKNHNFTSARNVMLQYRISAYIWYLLSVWTAVSVDSRKYIVLISDGFNNDAKGISSMSPNEAVTMAREDGENHIWVTKILPSTDSWFFPFLRSWSIDRWYHGKQRRYKREHDEEPCRQRQSLLEDYQTLRHQYTCSGHHWFDCWGELPWLENFNSNIM